MTSVIRQVERFEATKGLEAFMGKLSGDMCCVKASVWDTLTFTLHFLIDLTQSACVIALETSAV